MILLPTTLAFFGIGPLGFPELVVLALFGVLIFGKRLPEVGRSIGKGIVEFKKGLSGIEDEVDRQVKTPPQIESRPSPTITPTPSETSTTASDASRPA